MIFFLLQLKGLGLNGCRVTVKHRKLLCSFDPKPFNCWHFCTQTYEALTSVVRGMCNIVYWKMTYQASNEKIDFFLFGGKKWKENLFHKPRSVRMGVVAQPCVNGVAIYKSCEINLNVRWKFDSLDVYL